MASVEDRNPAIDILWSLNMPTKLPCFNWLLIKGKILTWDVLCKRVFCGSGFCVLCKAYMESMDCLFGDCVFFINVWAELSSWAHFDLGWDYGCLDDNLKKCYDSRRDIFPLTFITYFGRFGVTYPYPIIMQN